MEKKGKKEVDEKVSLYEILRVGKNATTEEIVIKLSKQN